MSIKTRYFSSWFAARTFTWLIFGFVAIMAATLFAFTTYDQLTHDSLPNVQIVNKILRLHLVANTVAPENLPHVLSLVGQRGVHTSLSAEPRQHFRKLLTVTPEEIKKIVNHDPGNVAISFVLDDSRWLNISTHHTSQPWLITGFGFSLFVLIVALVLLCDWAVQRLSVPFSEFSDATKRFGRDVNAPPMAMTGSPEMHEVIKSFNEMQARLRRVLNDRTQMLAAISHDLRTPITRLKLRAEFIKDKEQYQKVVDDLNEMEQMISSILSFARDYSREEAMTRFDFQALTESICNDMIDVGHEVEFHGIDKRILFLGRMSAIKRALTNIIYNAIKYGKTAKVSLELKENMLLVKVVDQGPGISETEMEKVFEPFYRVDPARSPEIAGTGLGLTVARDIVRAHDGEILLQNLPTKGLLVIIKLPIEKLK